MSDDHEVSPSPNVLAHDLTRQLRTIAAALALVERHFKQQHGPPTSTDALAIAREHIQAAIEALELVSQE